MQGVLLQVIVQMEEGDGHRGVTSSIAELSSHKAVGVFSPLSETLAQGLFPPLLALGWPCTETGAPSEEDSDTPFLLYFAGWVICLPYM